MFSFYLLGFLFVNNDLPYKTGVVDKVHILQNGSYGWEVNFTLEGDTKVYWQNYKTGYDIVLLYPPIFKLTNYIIHKGDTIKFAIDGSKDGYFIRPAKYLWQNTVSSKNKAVIYTEGLTVNGKVVANPFTVSLTRSSVEWVGRAGSIFLSLWLILFSLEASLWYDRRWTDKKIKKHFFQRNMFIR